LRLGRRWVLVVLVLWWWRGGGESGGGGLLVVVMLLLVLLVVVVCRMRMLLLLLLRVLTWRRQRIGRGLRRVVGRMRVHGSGSGCTELWLQGETLPGSRRIM